MKNAELSSEKFATGYFGIPGSSRGNFTVHLIGYFLELGARPVCGWEPSKEHEFQFCSWGVNYQFLECKTCRKEAKNLLKKEYENAVK